MRWCLPRWRSLAPLVRGPLAALFGVLTALPVGAHAGEPLALASPDSRLVVTFHPGGDGEWGDPSYEVHFGTRAVVVRSGLGLEFSDAEPLRGLGVIDTAWHSQRGEWRPVYGERALVADRFNELKVGLQEAGGSRRRIDFVFRAYDEGVAFCATLPRQPGWESVRIEREHTEFRFPADHEAWAVYSAQGYYRRVRLEEIKSGCERPLTIAAADDLYLAVGEARLVDHARMKLGPLSGIPHALVSELSSPVEAGLPLTTPWRVIMAAPSPGRLLENNDLFLNLNEPCAIAETSWIKPGKVIREVTLTTAGGKACVDFAVRRNLQYVEFDAGWYGPEGDDSSDATTVTVDPQRSPGPLDLPEVLRYARDRGIGVILYVNRRALERQLGEILPLYRSWGIAGVKYGFVNVGSQRWTTWLHDAVRQAAANRLMVDIHDEYRPTGYSRTYPNLMTQEGIAGDETRPKNDQTLTILFTRMLAGAADNTICYYDRRVDENASHAYQLAKAVCLYSPWQFLYWYDRPATSPARTGGAGGAQTGIGDEPELEFFDAVPTTWDETRALHGRIGEYAVIARRSGDEWFVGCLNSTVGRTLAIPFDFLPADRAYVAHVYSDDPSVATRTQVRIDRKAVNSTTVHQSVLGPQGGQAIHLVPAAAP